MRTTRRRRGLDLPRRKKEGKSYPGLPLIDPLKEKPGRRKKGK